MVLKGEALIDSFTLSYAIHGKPREWTVNVSTVGNIASECQTEEESPWPLLMEMLADGVSAIIQKFPGRAPRQRAGR